MSKELPKDTRTGSLERPNLIPVFIGMVVLLSIGGIVAALVIPDIAPTADANSNSSSLVGQKLYQKLLVEFGFEVDINRREIHGDRGMPPVLYLDPNPLQAERFLRHTLPEEFKEILSHRGTVVVTANKWQVRRDNKKPHWVGNRDLIPIEEVSELFAQLPLHLIEFPSELDIRRSEENQVQANFHGEIFRLELDRPQVFHRITGPATPLVLTVYGPLVLEIPQEKGRLLLVSDPDLFANYSVARSENAALALALTQSIAPERQVMLDEVVHGFGRDLSLFNLLFSYPMIFVTLQVCLAVVLFIFLMGRPFLPALPLPRPERSRKEQIHSIAQLTFSTGRHSFYLNRYFNCLVHQLEERFPVMKRMEEGEKLDFLDRVARDRDIPVKIKQVYSHLSSARSEDDVSRVLEQIYIWKESMIHGEH